MIIFANVAKSASGLYVNGKTCL